MRSKVALLVVALNLSWAVSLHAAERVIPTEWVRRYVHIRESPSTESPVIGRLERDEVATLLDRVPRWYKIELDGVTGFVSKSWTDVIFDLGARKTDEMRIHFLNIGAGTCTIVECPGAGAPPMIVDCGSLGGTQADLDADEAKAYIDGIIGNAPSVNLVISHADSDHYGFIPNVLADVTPTHIWQGGDPDLYTKNEFPAWIAAREDTSTLHRNFPPNWHNDGEPLGADLSCGDASTFALTVNTGDSSNSKSLVLLIEYKDFTVIFTGDAEGTTEAQAIANFPDGVRATVLTGCHHGASTHQSNSATWAAATLPVVTVFSAGRKFFHPRCAAVRRFDDSTANAREHPSQCGNSGAYEAVRRTDRAEYMTEVVGAVIVTTNGKSPLLVHCTRDAECHSEIDFF